MNLWPVCYQFWKVLSQSPQIASVPILSFPFFVTLVTCTRLYMIPFCPAPVAAMETFCSDWPSRKDVLFIYHLVHYNRCTASSESSGSTSGLRPPSCSPLEVLLMTGRLHLVQDAHNGQSLPWCSLSGSPKRIRSAGLWPNPSSSFLCSWESDMHCDRILPLLHFIVHGHHLKRIT